MTALYDIAAEYREAAEKLAELDLDEQTIADTLEGLGGDLQVKAQNVVFFARNLEAMAEAIKKAEGEMAKRRKAMENRSAGLLRYVLDSMQAAGVTKIECPHFRLSVRDNPGAVDVFEPELLPAQFMVRPELPPPAPDKKAISAALKAGDDVPGARLTAGKRLEVR
ncbi:siphovirus Gp157 family protein [Pseudorhodoferax sp. Leaf274]|uniref:siphovirus Gp157 family protein n=1 Tax=Pseudorhodoferax sp. Leaf274 TaxID=1736318 RepID=UPI000702E0E6|nr:siphovirus Gp157 family protein [Pseudorhodoferax sp. Leaf274]KQP36104.1 hypothetical protein ASF44_16170 [Pseudorhodoferax sp. Leaf274]